MTLRYTIEEKKLSLKYTWKIARNASDFKINFFIRIFENNIESIGEVAPNIRYNETPELVVKQFNHLLASGLQNQFTIHELTTFLNNQQVCNSLRFGIESAFIDFYCKKNHVSLATFLNIKVLEQPLATAFSIPIMPVNELNEFIQKHNLLRFNRIKVKVNKENAVELLQEVHRLLPNKELMVDGNETWQTASEILAWRNEVKHLPIIMLEQPLASELVNEYELLKPQIDIPLIADESITNADDLHYLLPQFHGINIKLMKTGSLIKGVKMLQEAKSLGLKTMIGCMVESSVGLSYALQICDNVDFIDLDGMLHLQNEPFNKLIEDKGYLRLQ